MNKKIEVDFINPFISAAVSVFKSLFNVNLVKGKVCANDNFFPERDVVVNITMSADTTGEILYCMDFNVVKKIADTLAPGMSDDQLRMEYKDIIGEVGNMITGNAMTVLSDKGIEISTPTVYNGADYKSLSKRGKMAIIIKLYSPFGPIEIVIILS